MLGEEVRCRYSPSMYPSEMSPLAASIAIPKQRRRYYCASPLSSSPEVNGSPSLLVKGCAHLCFCEDGSWFEGHLIADEDESQYGLTGRLVQRAPTAAAAVSSSSPQFAAYDVTVNDNDDEETYSFPSVLLTSFDPLCALLSARFSFTADKAYRGQKADMLIQRYLTPRLVGKNLTVCAGRLTADLSPTVHSNSLKRSGSPLWCL